MAPLKFVTAINCMDGRVQQPIIDWMKQTFQAEHVDMITEPGPIKRLAETPTDNQSIKERVAISVNKHGSPVVAVVGHHDCTGNPADQQTQITQIQDAIETIQSWENQITVIGLYIDENWQVHQITE